MLVLTNLTSRDRAIIAATYDKQILSTIIEEFEFSKSTLIKSMKSKNDDAKIVGIDIISDKLTLLSRENPRNIAPEMVFPDLDVPGISANACQTPMISASLYDQSRLNLFFLPYLSDIYRIRPKIIIPNPMTFKDLIS